jgi:hypothetical protein
MGTRSDHAAGGPDGAHANRGRRASGRPSASRLTAPLTLAAASVAVVITAVVAPARPGASRTAALIPQTKSPSPSAHRRPALLAAPAARPDSSPLALTTADRRSCPPAAAACVDLARHISWLQSAGQVTFGPVAAEPGPPGSAHATPRGTFQVTFKAGPNLISNIYHEPMPWAVFFAPGGIAFHGGSLTTPSHGCVHLTTADAHYYNEHLPLGAEVVVF